MKTLFILLLLLVGCSKDNFFKLLELMQYKAKNNIDEKEIFFTYKPKFIKNKEKINDKKTSKNNPFSKLTEIRFR